MAESPSLMFKARDILATPSHEGLENVLHQLCTLPQETTEYQKALSLFNFCAAHFTNCLTLKLLQTYQRSSIFVLRYQSIYLLSETLVKLKTRRLKLSPVALNHIKPLLISCLKIQESIEPENETLRKLVSLVAYDVVVLHKARWDELSKCIVELASTEPVKAFHVFLGLPPVYGRFINTCGLIIMEKASRFLVNPEQDRLLEWCLGLQAIVKLVIQILSTEMRFDLVKNHLIILVYSVKVLIEKGMEQFLLRGLENLEMFLSRDKSLCRYNERQCFFLSMFMYKIKDLGTHTKEAAIKINLLLKSIPSPVQQEQRQEKPQDSERVWLDRLNKLSPTEILRVFASDDVEERFRDMAIRQLHVLLSDHTSRKELIEISVMRELQPLLISCLSREEGITESMFKVLGEVVYHVAREMMNSELEIWYGLSDYFASKCKIEFERAVYVFQCLTIWLESDFVIPMMESLLPEISTRLNPPKELLIDNSSWGLAFVGAFCAIIHLVEIESHAESVKEIADKMVDSVKEIVERNMEVGLVRRAFRDVESIVKKQKDWFSKNEYKLIKALLQRLYVIKGMKMETKMVLWRINAFVDREMTRLIGLWPLKG